MQVKLTLEFDLDCEEEKEKYEAINDILAEKEESDDSDAADYESYASELDSYIQEELDEAKSGSAVARKLEEIQEKITELKSDNNIEE